MIGVYLRWEISLDYPACGNLENLMRGKLRDLSLNFEPNLFDNCVNLGSVVTCLIACLFSHVISKLFYFATTIGRKMLASYTFCNSWLPTFRCVISRTYFSWELSVVIWRSNIPTTYLKYLHIHHVVKFRLFFIAHISNLLQFTNISNKQKFLLNIWILITSTKCLVTDFYQQSIGKRKQFCLHTNSYTLTNTPNDSLVLPHNDIHRNTWRIFSLGTWCDRLKIILWEHSWR